MVAQNAIVNLRSLHGAGYSARLESRQTTKSYGQNTELEKAVQKSAAQNRQAEAAGEATKESTLVPLSPSDDCLKPLRARAAIECAAQFFTQREKKEWSLRSGWNARRWRLVIALDDSGWWVFK